MKICTKCGQNKEYNQYYKKLNGLTAQCKDCLKETKQKPENMEKRRIWENNWINENRELHRERKQKCRKKYPETQLLKRARRRAMKNNIEFNIDRSDCAIPIYCPVLGIELCLNDEAQDNSPSLDRIDSTKGYIKGNVIVISNRANKLKKDATLEELFKLADRYGKLLYGPDYKIPD